MIHKERLFSILLASSMFSYGQNYIHLGNLSGVGYSNTQLQQLEVGASTLIDEFPATFQDSFRVYDFSLYHLMDYTQEGLSEIVASIDPDNLAQTKYYYTIIRVFFKDGTIKYYPFLKLPRSGIFECYTEVKWESLYSQLSNNLQPHEFEGITSSLAFLKIKIAEIAACCEPGTRNSCTLCLTSEEVENIFSTREGYIRSNSNVRYDNSLIYSNSNERSGEILIGDGKWIIDYIEQGTSIFEVVDYHLDQLTPMGLTFQAFVTSNDDICSVENKFEEIENEFKSSQADVILRIHIDNESGKIYEYVEFDNIIDYFDSLTETFFEDLASALIANNRIDPNNLAGSRTFCDDNAGRLLLPKSIDLEPTTCQNSPGVGLMAHYLIQLYAKQFCFIYAISPSMLKVEYGIPKIEPGIRYADIVDIQNKEIYEIKTVCSWKDGNKQVAEYISLANRRPDGCVEKHPPKDLNFSKGKRMFQKKVTIPWSRKKSLHYKLHDEKGVTQNGVVTYWFTDNGKTKKPRFVPDEIPKPIFVPWYSIPPSSTGDAYGRIIDFVKESYNVENPRWVAYNYLKDNLDLIYTVIAAGSIVILLDAAITAGSGGSLAPATVPIAIFTSILVGTALTFDINNPPSPNS